MGAISRFFRDQSGQFAIMFAAASTMLLMGVMVAVDMSKLTNSQARVTVVTDAAALAGAQAFDSADRVAVVQAFLDANGDQMLPASMTGTPVIGFDDNTREVSVLIEAEVDLPFANVLGMSDKNVIYRSVAVYPDDMDPLTIAFALDISGSMGGTTSDGVVKIDALKTASEEMFNVIEGKVKNPQTIEKYIRTSVSAFESTLTVDQEMTWGFADTRQTIQNLNRGGGTNTLAALDDAHQKILDDRMFRISADPTFDLATLDEFVIFMTDGQNTAGDPVILDDSSYERCVEMREDGIEIYSIGFAAPDRGKLLLLDCASWDDAVEDTKSKHNHNKKRGCKFLSGIAGAFPNVEALKNAYKRCKNNNGDEKKEHFYDAADAKSFEEIFRIIGEKINESSIRIKT